MTTSMVGTISRLGLLQALPGLDELPAPAMAVLADVARERHYPARARLAGPRLSSPVAHVVVEGELMLEVPGGKRVRIPAGQHVGWWTVLADDAMSYELSTRRGAFTLALDREALLEIADHSGHGFEVLHGLARSIATRLVQRGGVLSSATVLRPDFGPDVLVGAGVSTGTHTLGTVERILHLRRLPIFRGVNLDVVSQLAAAFELRRPEPSWPIATRALHLLRGRVTWEGDGGAGDSIEAPALIGLPHALAGKPMESTLCASSDALALEVDVELLLDLAEDNPDLALGLVTALAARLRAQTVTP